MGSSPKYVIATFGRYDNPARLLMAADNPNFLYLNDTRIGQLSDLMGWNTANVVVSANRVTVNDKGCDFAGNARCFLGNAYPESRLTASKYIDFDISEMEPICRLPR